MCGQPVSPYSHCRRGGTAVTVNGWFGEEVEGRCVGSQYLLTVTAVEVARQSQSMVGSVRRLKGGVWAASISLQSLPSRWHGSHSQWFGEEVEGRCVGSQYLLTVTAVEVARQSQSMVR